MWSNPFQGKPQRWVFLPVPSSLSLGTAVESTRVPVQDLRMKPLLAFRAGYLGGPAAGWEPSKLGCMAEHLLGARLDVGDLSGSHGVLWAGTHAVSTTAFPVLFRGVIFSLIVCGHILDFPQRNYSTCSYVFGASEEAGQFIFESDGSTLWLSCSVSDVGFGCLSQSIETFWILILLCNILYKVTRWLKYCVFCIFFLTWSVHQVRPMNWLNILLLFSIPLAIQQFSLLLAVQIDLALLINNLWQFNKLEIYKALFVSLNFYPHPYNISQETWLNTWLRGSSQVSAAFPSVPPCYLGQWVIMGLLCRVSLLVQQCCFQWLPPHLWKCFLPSI